MNDLIKALNLPSPIQSFYFKEYPDRRIFIKRDDLIHPHISGNKWRKLKYNIKYALDHNCEGIISFGGAFSNHLYALAAACRLARLKCISFVRGTELDYDNPTLKFLIANKVTIKEVPRSVYRSSFQPDGIERLKSEYPNYHIIPEGGSNELAFQGVKEIMDEVYTQEMPEELLVVAAVGSGATITGLVKGLNAGSSALGMLAVNDQSLTSKVYSKLSEDEKRKVRFDNKTHLGGFAKTNQDLINFVNQFYQHTNIPIDPIYNGKLLYRLREMLVAGDIQHDRDILVIHTGGLQGNLGFDYRFPRKLDPGLLGK